MSHNAYIRAGGVWNTGLVVLHGEFAAFDAAQFKSINGDDGGTWAPSAQITIGGAGAQLNLVGANILKTGGSLDTEAGSQITINLSSALAIYGSVVANSSATLSYAAGSAQTFSGASTYASGSSVTVAIGSTWTFNNAPTFAGLTTFSGNAIFSGTASFNGIASFTSNVDIVGPCAIHGSALSVAAPTTISGPTTVSALLTIAGSAVYRDVLGVDANHTYVMNSVDTVIVPVFGGITADRTYTLDVTGAPSGSRITIANYNPSFSITVIGPFEGGSSITLKNATGNTVSEQLTLIGGVLYPRARFAL